MNALDVVAVTAGYGQETVLDGLSLQVESGAVTAVVGPSGCGKTTLLRAIAGFVAITGGRIDIAERTVTGPGVFVPPERRGVALVPQEGALFPHLDVAGNVAFGLSARRAGRGRDARAVAARVAELLDLVGLGGFENRHPHELSGGQQQRVALARALAPHPTLVLLDEPFSALDAGLRESVRAEVRAALHRVGATALLVTHDQDEALSVADKVAVLTGGRVAMHDVPSRVYRTPSALSVARFIGQVVELPAIRVGQIAQTALGDIALLDGHEPDANQHRSSPDGPQPGTPSHHATGVLTLRPEQLCLESPESAVGVAGRVVRSAYYGHDATVAIRLADDPHGSEVLVRTSGSLPDTDLVRISVNGPGLFFARPAD